MVNDMKALCVCVCIEHLSYAETDFKLTPYFGGSNGEQIERRQGERDRERKLGSCINAFECRKNISCN